MEIDELGRRRIPRAGEPNTSCKTRSLGRATSLGNTGLSRSGLSKAMSLCKANRAHDVSSLKPLAIIRRICGIPPSKSTEFLTNPPPAACSCLTLLLPKPRRGLSLRCEAGGGNLARG
jgi:hypothetical protein